MKTPDIKVINSLISDSLHRNLMLSSTGISNTVSDGYYRRKVFGAYTFHSTDNNGNRVYYLCIEGQTNYLYKNANGNWMVSSAVSLSSR